jgi:hypothetical protein
MAWHSSARAPSGVPDTAVVSDRCSVGQRYQRSDTRRDGPQCGRALPVRPPAWGSRAVGCARCYHLVTGKSPATAQNPARGALVVCAGMAACPTHPAQYVAASSHGVQPSQSNSRGGSGLIKNVMHVTCPIDSGVLDAPDTRAKCFYARRLTHHTDPLYNSAAYLLCAAHICTP